MKTKASESSQVEFDTNFYTILSNFLPKNEKSMMTILKTECPAGKQPDILLLRIEKENTYEQRV